MPSVLAQDLTKTYKTKNGLVEAVVGVSFEVAQGEIVGFLGQNGAGKTTTLRMLTTLLKPTSGSARVAGYALASDAQGVRRKIGYVAQSGGTSPSASARSELVLQGRLYQMHQADAVRRADQLIREFDLEDLAERPTITLSGGQRRRLDIALGLTHQPAVLFLDEPSAALDPQSRNLLWDHVRKVRENYGTTVFLSTHYLDEADALCDRVLIIDHGRVVAEDSPANLKAQLGHDVVTIELAAGADRAAAVLAPHPAVHDVKAEAQALRLTVEHNDRVLLQFLRTLDEAGIEPLSIQVERPTLDDVFLSITGRSIHVPGQQPLSV
ncbi:ATP-binding cassette domain-containing protein [Streptacidiphilus sp. EB129]|uniref:ATP-binding cassette domain-containing protein n=1 Tax=Streptacidiphilus sp. EB129 TaxID=3156262 RepID=UPI003510FC73